MIEKKYYPCKQCGQLHLAYESRNGRIVPEYCCDKCSRAWKYQNVEKPQRMAGLTDDDPKPKRGRRPHKQKREKTDRSYIDRIRACVINAKGDYRPPRSITEVS